VSFIGSATVGYGVYSGYSGYSAYSEYSEYSEYSGYSEYGGYSVYSVRELSLGEWVSQYSLVASKCRYTVISTQDQYSC
jgi:hypothetical protein